jgi:hypothetical protein
MLTAVCNVKYCVFEIIEKVLMTSYYKMASMEDRIKVLEKQVGNLLYNR